MPELDKIKSSLAVERDKVEQALEELQTKQNKVNEKKAIIDKHVSEIETDNQQIENKLLKVDPIVKDAVAKVKKIDDKVYNELFNQNTPSQKMIDVLEIFLEIYKIKNPRIN
jgi:predicted  nucleic acid-binding Zn-ribbon protein